jgi:hypothetical protein
MALSKESSTTTADRVAELERTLAELTQGLYLVFENDWHHTRSMIEDDRGIFIKRTGTFLNPKVTDESNDWANRSSLLNTYRRAVELLRRDGIDPEDLHPGEA